MRFQLSPMLFRTHGQRLPVGITRMCSDIVMIWRNNMFVSGTSGAHLKPWKRAKRCLPRYVATTIAMV